MKIGGSEFFQGEPTYNEYQSRCLRKVININITMMPILLNTYSYPKGDVVIVKKLENIGLILFAVLFFWFSLVFIGVPRLLIDGHEPLFSLSGLLELGLIIIWVGYLFKWKYTDFLNLFILIIWGYMQYDSHWRYMLFKAPKEIIDSYYQHFYGTLRFFAESETRVVPDAYHIILGVLIVINISIVLVKIMMFLKFLRKDRV